MNTQDTNNRKQEGKEIQISATAFVDLKLEFILKRLNQFVERTGMSWEQVESIFYKGKNSQSTTDEIDRVVDVEFHSNKLPDVSMYEII